MSELGQDTSINFFSEMVLPDFENKYYLKDNESNYTLRNHKSCQKPWHGQRQKFKSVLHNLHDVEMGHYRPRLQFRVSFSFLFYFGFLSFPLLLYQTATLVNFMVGSKPFYPL